MNHLKWKISKKDVNSFVNSIRNCDTAIDRLIVNQKIKYSKLLSDLRLIKDRYVR
jgi:hypothetical protein